MPELPKRHSPPRQPKRTQVHRPQSERWGKGRGGRPWRRLRDQVMQRDKYLCQHCLAGGRYTEAQEVDHIVPLADGGTDAATNLQALCAPCHRKK